MTRTILHILISLMFPFYLSAQNQPVNNSILSLKQFYEIVYAHHPLSKQAKLIVENAKSMNLAAKGNFDPKLFYQFNSSKIRQSYNQLIFIF